MSKPGSATPSAFVRTVILGDCDSTSVGWRIEEAKDGPNKQREKIRQIGEALRRAGLVTITQQASAVGLSRSTTWKILRADHKASGLHAHLIGRMLARKELPSSVRGVLREYVVEKALGNYGHSLERRRRFAAYFCNVPELARLLKNI